jgi:hypothetical protein
MEAPAGRGTSGQALLLYLRALGLVYAAAFGSLGLQIDGLMGPSGILPVAHLLTVARPLGAVRFWLLPTVFWIFAGSAALKGVCLLGTFLGLVMAAGVLPFPISIVLWCLYLSIVSVGGIFMGYQWDTLLLEAGLLSVVAAPLGLRPRTGVGGLGPVLALRFLLFRLMLSSGLVKLLSGDEAWRSLSALSFHYETQPLPTWVGWYAALLPAWAHRLSTLGTFLIEIGAPLFVFFGPRMRLVAFVPIVALQLLIALTGNYGFFNGLTLALCLPLLDDRFVPVLLRARGAEAPSRSRAREACAFGLMAFALLPFLSGLGTPLPAILEEAAGLLEPLHVASAYGLFAVMTTERLEIVVEGSDDGVEWKTYAFPWKPGDPSRAPAFVAPHQPRLDWQMWFAALGSFERNPWFSHFMARLLEGTPEVLSLLSENPFPSHPPRYVRAELYRYRFSNPEDRARLGVWWTREDLGAYSPVLHE